MTTTSPPTLAQIRERDAQYNPFSSAMGAEAMYGSDDRRELLRLLDESHSHLTKLEADLLEECSKRVEAEQRVAESHAQIDGLMKRLLREEADSKRRHELLKLCHADAVRLYDGLFTAVNGVIGPRHMKLLRDHYSYSRTAQSGSGEAARQGCYASQGGGDG